MKPLDYPLLADENVQPEVIRRLKNAGKTVSTVFDLNLAGKGDDEILQKAYHKHWCVLTHDGDFGTIAIRNGQPFLGIIYLRPGHYSADFVWETLRYIDSTDLIAVPPFLLIAERRQNAIRIRIRQNIETILP
jgi:predicted nuclease of predicted toxin-antitoxin system